MSKFQDKKVCLVLSCDRPYYKQRRESNYETYRWFQQNGFSVVFLFAGVEGDESKLSENHDGTYTLRVPSLEVYELLSHKMELAYKFFSSSGCTGILKIDDDIKIVDPIKLSHILETHTLRYDYLGITAGFLSSKGGTPLVLKKYSLNLFKSLRVREITEFAYAGGPFYWVSSKAIQYLANDGLEFFYEDASVGYVINKHIELNKIYIQWAFNTVVRWDNESEA